MIPILLLFILPLTSFAINDVKQTRTLPPIHPIWRFDDTIKNDNSTQLGICYGSNTQWSSYPYIVALNPTISTIEGCTGTIIDMGSSSQGRQATILTAAHCRNQISNGVYVGCNNPRNCNGAVRYSAVTSSFTTWNYQNPNPYSNDIAIFRLTTPITSPSGATAVRLNNNIGLNSRTSRITGYGIDETRSKPSILQTGQTQFVSRSTCQSRWSGITIESNTICIQDPSNTINNPGVTACRGDSGGPMSGSDGTQYGVLAFTAAGRAGGPCEPYSCHCCPHIPQVGMSVAHFITQICSAIGGNNLGC